MELHPRHLLELFENFWPSSAVNVNGVPGYEALRVEAGVYVAEGETCQWRGSLRDSEGVLIDQAEGYGDLASGASTIALEFNGPRIFRSQKDGPYTIAAELIRGSESVSEDPLFVTQEFLAADFENTAADFSLSVEHATVSAPPETAALFIIGVTPGGGFGGDVAFTASGLPTGDTAVFQWPVVQEAGNTYLEVTPAAGTPAGTYSFTVTATSGALIKTISPTLLVTAGLASVSVSPASLQFHRRLVPLVPPANTQRRRVIFKPAFDGTRKLYVKGYDSSGNSSDWRYFGDWSVAAAHVPQTLSVVPGDGAGSGPQEFRFRFVDPDGYADIAWTQMLIGTSQYSGMQVCYLHYSASSRALYISTDSGLGGWLDSGLPGDTGTLANSQCGVDLSGASVSEIGSVLELTLPITFSSSFLGDFSVYSKVDDMAGNGTGWSQPATWTVPGNSAPQAGTVSPNSGYGHSAPFTFTYSDTDGWENLRILNGMINDGVNTVNSCYFTVYRTLNCIYLMSDAGTAYLTPVTMGTSETAENSQCKITGTGAAAAGSGDTFSVTVPVTFKSSLDESVSIYLTAYDAGNVSSGWMQQAGT